VDGGFPSTITQRSNCVVFNSQEEHGDHFDVISRCVIICTRARGVWILLLPDPPNCFCHTNCKLKLYVKDWRRTNTTSQREHCYHNTSYYVVYLLEIRNSSAPERINSNMCYNIIICGTTLSTLVLNSVLST
jgi:hypothetical protein